MARMVRRRSAGRLTVETTRDPLSAARGIVVGAALVAPIWLVVAWAAARLLGWNATARALRRYR